MDESGYLILLGAIGLALDVLHVFCGVRQTIVHEDQSLSRPLWQSGVLHRLTAPV